MSWHDLLFLHWPVDPQQLRPLVAEQFELDLFAGEAWIGLVPFAMTGIRPRFLPAVPRWMKRPNVSCFLELNVRTYVRVGDKAGVLFFSLDAQSPLAVRLAREVFHLPYFNAQMRCDAQDEGWLRYESRRTHKDAPGAEFSVQYRPEPGSQPQTGAPGTLEYFLTERYCLYTLDEEGCVLRGDIHHRPWPLQTAEVDVDQIRMTDSLGITLSAPPHCAHFARRLDVIVWKNARMA